MSTVTREIGGLFATLKLLGEDVGAAGEIVRGAQVAVLFGVAGALDELIDAGDERQFGGGEAAALGLRHQLEGLAPVILRRPPQLLLHVSGQDFLNGRPGRFGGRRRFRFGRRCGLASRALRRLVGRRRRGGWRGGGWRGRERVGIDGLRPRQLHLSLGNRKRLGSWRRRYRRSGGGGWLGARGATGQTKRQGGGHDCFHWFHSESLGHTASGRRITKVVPLPGSLLKSIVPSCNCTIRKVMARPMPLPPVLVVKYRRKIFSFRSGGMPEPVSEMRISAVSLEAEASKRSSPPSGMAWMALTTTVRTACLKRSRSTLTSTPSAPETSGAATTWMLAAAAWGRARSAISPRICCRRTGRSLSSTGRVKSRKVFTTRSSRRISREMISIWGSTSESPRASLLRATST